MIIFQKQKTKTKTKQKINFFFLRKCLSIEEKSQDVRHLSVGSVSKSAQYPRLNADAYQAQAFFIMTPDKSRTSMH